MAAKRKLEQLKESINNVRIISDGIRHARSLVICTRLTPEQERATYIQYNLELLNAINHIEQIKKELSQIEDSLTTNPTEIRKPGFSGIQFSHPLNFLEDLMAYFKQIPIKYRTIETIVDCFYMDANSWALIFKERWTNIEEFVNDFLEQFWGRAEQSRLKIKIVSGVWDEKQETMAQHFASLVNQAKWLPRRIPEDELIYDIMRHFPRSIRKEWESTKQSTILEAISFLKKMDEKKMPTEDIISIL